MKKTIILLGIFTLMLTTGLTLQTGEVCAAPEVIKLKFADFFTPKSDNAKLIDIFCERIKERTGGRVGMTIYHAETLGKMKDSLDMLDRGVCDIAAIACAFFPGQFNVENITDLPFMGIPSRTVARHMQWELYYQGYFKELEKYKVIYFDPGALSNIFLRDKKVITTEDFKGLKMRSPDPGTRKVWELLGATAVAIPPPEVYMALDRGMIDGITTGWDFFVAAKMHEVIKYCIWRPGVSCGNMVHVMKKDVWNGLPPDIQIAIDQVIVSFPYEIERYHQENDPVKLLRETGVEVYDLSPNESAKLMDKAVAVRDEWVKDMENKGLPAKKMLEACQKIINRYK